MEVFKVKTESAIKRCEVCHKTDLFDPTLEKCYRCENLAESLKEGTIVSRPFYQPSLFLWYARTPFIDVTIVKTRVTIIIIMLLLGAFLYLYSVLFVCLVFLLLNPFTYFFCMLYIKGSLAGDLFTLKLNPKLKRFDNHFGKYDSISEESPYWKLEFEKNI